MFDPSEIQWAKADFLVRKPGNTSGALPRPISEGDIERFLRLIRGVLGLLGSKMKKSGGVRTLAREIPVGDKSRLVEVDDTLVISVAISDCWAVARDVCPIHRHFYFPFDVSIDDPHLPHTLISGPTKFGSCPS